MRSVNKNGRFYNIMCYFYILIIIKITNNDYTLWEFGINRNQTFLLYIAVNNLFHEMVKVISLNYFIFKIFNEYFNHLSVT